MKYHRFIKTVDCEILTEQGSSTVMDEYESSDTFVHQQQLSPSRSCSRTHDTLPWAVASPSFLSYSTLRAPPLIAKGNSVPCKSGDINSQRPYLYATNDEG